MTRISKRRRKERKSKRIRNKKLLIGTGIALVAVPVLIGAIVLAASLISSRPKTVQTTTKTAETPQVKKTVTPKPVKKTPAYPTLEIDEPENGATIRETTVIVRGRTEPGNSILVEGKKLPVAADGAFAFKLDLVYGMNIARITAQNAAGKTVEKEIAVNCVQKT